MSLIGEGIEIMKLVDRARNVDLYKELGQWIDKVLDLQKTNDELTGNARLFATKFASRARLNVLGGILSHKVTKRRSAHDVLRLNTS